MREGVASSSTKQEILQFHADRVKESTLRVLQSILSDPRFSMEEKLELLTSVSGVHVEMAELVHTALSNGCMKAVSMLQAGVPNPR